MGDKGFEQNRADTYDGARPSGSMQVMNTMYRQQPPVSTARWDAPVVWAESHPPEFLGGGSRHGQECGFEKDQRQFPLSIACARATQ